MSKTDIDKLLSELHSEVAQQLLARIRSGNATAGDFMAAIRFLKENGIDSLPTPGSPVADLAEHVPFPTRDTDFH